MKIKISRKRKNELYTESVLLINGLIIANTVEATVCMLPAGNYELRIVKKSQRKQAFVIFMGGKPTNWTIDIGISWIVSKKKHIIAIGQRFFPGAVNRAIPIFERITDRLMKCEARGESIQFVISEDECENTKPIKHWLERVDC